jgi:hypothetical protein
MGMTYIVLDRADEGTMRGALVVAHKNVESKQTSESGKVKAEKKRAR